MAKTHTYTLTVDWTGNRGTGTSAYGAYGRDHAIRAPGKPVLAGSSDPAFRGDPARYNPEELLVAAIAACHMLWYLHLCAVRKIVVTAYRDEPVGIMEVGTNGGGRFTQVTLRPAVTLAPGCDEDLAKRLHDEAHAKCFIANSVNFPIAHAATVATAAA